MLYNPDWQKLESKIDIFSVSGLKTWLETKEQSAGYHYGDIHNCLLSQYFRAQGYRWAYCGSDIVSYSVFFLPPLFYKRIPSEMNEISIRRPWTFGAALDRARKAIA